MSAGEKRAHPHPDEPPPHVDDFDWSTWTPGVQATLVFIRRGAQLLLIEKKTGIGQGKINAPGGKLEEGETFLECACREVEEEVHLKVDNLSLIAELRFLMSDYPDILCQAFLTTQYQGEPTETEEAAPIWIDMDQIPWDRMWEDDQYWLPRALQGEQIKAFFSFKREEMCSMRVETM